MECQVVEGSPVAARLAELGLSPEILRTALQDADAEARQYTAMDPPGAAGLARYFRTVRRLREQLAPAGWTYDNPRNLCRTISPDGRIAIITALGTEATGDPTGRPTTRYEKGIATVDVVNRNFLEQTLFDLDDPELGAEPDPTTLATWVLLYYVTDTEIRAELSLPDSMVDGHIDTWLERIILPPIPLASTPDPHLVPVPLQSETIDQDDIEVIVTRRSS